MCDNYFDEQSLPMPPLPEIILDAALNFLATDSLYDDHLLPGNEDGLYLESLVNVITFHVRTCNLKCCNSPCNHKDKTDAENLYDYNDLTLPSSDVSLSWYSTSSCDLDNWDVDKPESVSDPPSEAVIAELKQQCIHTINDKLAAFPASL